MGQLGFGFDGIAGSKTPPANAAEDELLVDGEPRELFAGAQRLEAYLSESSMGWVVRLAGLLKELDYSAFISA
jgi:hypothetical protein